MKKEQYLFISLPIYSALNSSNKFKPSAVIQKIKGEIIYPGLRNNPGKPG